MALHIRTGSDYDDGGEVTCENHVNMSSTRDGLKFRIFGMLAVCGHRYGGRYLYSAYANRTCNLSRRSCRRKGRAEKSKSRLMRTGLLVLQLKE